MLSFTDVIIIGAGPAATATAITLRQKGLSCLIVEREQMPRYRPGETLHPGMEVLFRKLGVWEAVLERVYLRPRGVLVRQFGIEQLMLYGQDADGEWRGFQMARQVLDSLLLSRAESLGAHLQLQSRALRLNFKQGNITGVRTDKGDFLARFVVDCGGGRHWIGKQLRLTVRRYSPRLFARFGYFMGRGERIYDSPLMEFDNFGWTWLAQVQENLLHWTRLDVTLSTGKQRLLLPCVSAHIRRSARFAGVDELIDFSSTRGADVTWRILEAPAGPSYFAAGDAAAVIDPASSQGVLKAVMSGIYVGYLIERVLTNPTIQPIVIAEYTRWLYAWFLNDISILARRYSRTFPDWVFKNGNYSPHTL